MFWGKLWNSNKNKQITVSCLVDDLHGCHDWYEKISNLLCERKLNPSRPPLPDSDPMAKGPLPTHRFATARPHRVVGVFCAMNWCLECFYEIHCQNLYIWSYLYFDILWHFRKIMIYLRISIYGYNIHIYFFYLFICAFWEWEEGGMTREPTTIILYTIYK